MCISSDTRLHWLHYLASRVCMNNYCVMQTKSNISEKYYNHYVRKSNTLESSICHQTVVDEYVGCVITCYCTVYEFGTLCSAPRQFISSSTSFYIPSYLLSLFYVFILVTTMGSFWPCSLMLYFSVIKSSIPTLGVSGCPNSYGSHFELSFKCE